LKPKTKTWFNTCLSVYTLHVDNSYIETSLIEHWKAQIAY